MKTRVVFTIIASLGAVPAGRALADEHHMRVNELFLSDPIKGDSVQFVELTDSFGEEFPEDTYQLGIYDTAGELIATVPVDPPEGTTMYLVATEAAEKLFGVTAEARLSETLPPEGQICFEVVEDGETEHISCLAYGCVDNIIEGEFAQNVAMSPLDGQSLQRQQVKGPHPIRMAEPTPHRLNIDGVATQPECAPPPPPDDEEEPPPDETPPPDQEEPPIVDDDDDGCAVAGGSTSGSLAGLIGLGLVVARRRRRRAARSRRDG